MYRKTLILFSCSLLWAASILRAENSAVIRFTTNLKYTNGKYASIFGVIPKEYVINSKDLLIVDVVFSTNLITAIEVRTAKNEQILEAKNDLPVINTQDKKISGLKLRIKNDVIDVERTDDQELTENEKTDAQRLAKRYLIQESLFNRLDFDEKGIAILNLKRLLSFLGYTDVYEESGRAILMNINSNELMTGMKIECSFKSGKNENGIYVELKGNGKVSLPASRDYVKEIRLQGDLVIHGQRKLADGRVVPFNLITDFEYDSVSEKMKDASLQ